MIWRRKDPAENHFPTFHHQEARIAALEADFLALSRALLDYLGEIMPPGEHLAETLRAIIETREAKK